MRDSELKALKERRKRELDALCKRLFAQGGPMLPTEIKRKGFNSSKRHEGRVFILNPRRKPCPALLAEQQRLIKTWDE